LLNHFGGFLLLTAIAVHFTDEPGMSCPWRQNDSTALFSTLSILALQGEVLRATLDKLQLFF